MYIDPAYIYGAEFKDELAVYINHPLSLRSVGGTVYKFRKAREALIPHSHVPGKSHLVVVFEGSVIYRETGEEGNVDKVYDAPSLILVPDNVTHSVISVSDTATTLHILLSKLAD